MISDDFKISDKLMAVYNTINYYNKYKELSEKYNTEEERLEKTDKKIILEIFKNLGYTAKYKSGERFYQILEDSEGIDFYFHISLTYGLTELIFGVLRKKDEDGKKIGEIIGGTACGVCELIEINKHQENEGYIKDPRFRTYEELTAILQEAFVLYEDLKEEILKSYFN